MKKILFLAILPVIFLISGCSFSDQKDSQIIKNYPELNTSSNICAVPLATSTVTATSTATSKNILPPVSQEEKSKTFTYEDEELGVKMKYPGSCYFNKGVFQCSDITLSVWVLDGTSKPSTTPEKTFKDGQTQLKYTYINKNKIYALMAWYDGENKSDLEVLIDRIAKSVTFTK